MISVPNSINEGNHLMTLLNYKHLTWYSQNFRVEINVFGRFYALRLGEGCSCSAQCSFTASRKSKEREHGTRTAHFFVQFSLLLFYGQLVFILHLFFVTHLFSLSLPLPLLHFVISLHIWWKKKDLLSSVSLDGFSDLPRIRMGMEQLMYPLPDKKWKFNDVHRKSFRFLKWNEMWLTKAVACRKCIYESI